MTLRFVGIDNAHIAELFGNAYIEKCLKCNATYPRCTINVMMITASTADDGCDEHELDDSHGDGGDRMVMVAVVVMMVMVMVVMMMVWCGDMGRWLGGWWCQASIASVTMHSAVGD